MKTRIALALAAGTLLLASCGGGGSSGTSPGVNTGTSSVPSSAQTSVTGLVAYIQQLIAGSNDTDEPVSLDNVTLPTDDTAEPAAI